jgi:NAD(P)-dependent dehydrogenase (short-subunit alcohol dehydrogenase family)
MTVIVSAARGGGIMKLTGKKALITGGNSGIGLATARLFIAEGAQIAITGRDPKTLEEAVAELGPNARGYRADVTVAEDRKQLFATLAKDFGKLDIVFANAGISGQTPTGSTDEAISRLEEFFSSVVPLGRWGEPEEIAKAVLFLASEDSSYVNAVELVVDGGLTGAQFGAPILRASA